MIELDSKEFGKVLPLLERMKINTLFAEAILAGKVPGKVYVDRTAQPQAYYVAHPYGMSLLFGEPENEAFKQWLYDYTGNLSGTREQVEWLQADPDSGWTAVMETMVKEHNTRSADKEPGNDGTIQCNTRVNFRFSREAYLEAKSRFRWPEAEIVPTDAELFRTTEGGVVPRYFWRDAAHFASAGAGFSLLAGGEIASTAFSSCRTERQLEIGIETGEVYRGKGYAFAVCSAMIDYCLEHELEPVWACRLENQGSYVLAQKLGFVPAVTLPYYRLPV
ncbi:GNAT family N-acetyltransferase [Paenibacillus tepidiphilus]|uniref:GNAT family N-acetyltransferase n=1 Tax=Paenibacillus tepidiphilus TaxID=2608683 RepID=UPI0012386569|nr:GNAT family N-acetyltransferase [Paenibacillus tepidiphilus]